MVPKRVLILTPSSGFGGLIRQVLEDTGAYLPFLFSQPEGALEQARKDAIALIVLDAELGPQATPALLSELRRLAPHARLIVLPTEEDPHEPWLKGLGADAILPSPFYLPDLVAAVEQFFGPLVSKEPDKRAQYGDAVSGLAQPTHEPASAPEWLSDVSQAARYLTRLSLESDSQAALVTRGEQVWAYAGELPKRAADELAAAVADHAASGSHADGNAADLARFIHLEATKGDHMLYATSLGGEFRLALVFDAQMPFSQMRAQASELARALATAPQEVLSRGETVRDAESELTPEPRMQQVGGEQATPPHPPRKSEEQPLPAAQARPGSGPVTKSLRTAVPGSSDLQYSIVLIPRLPKHHLSGDLAANLAVWLPELCLAFAWRLESVSVEPTFLQWTVTIPADTPPDSAVRTLDTHLSRRIFEEFPRLARENPSGQFWAPGYLIVSGAKPSAAQVAEYIQYTRNRQGVAG
ncbi:MAG: transposase [Anaerolineales bacterium]